MRALIIFAVVVIVASVTLITEARRPTCKKKAFWRKAYKKNNRIGWDDFVDHIAGGSYLNTYIVYQGVPLVHIAKGENQYWATTDLTVNTLGNEFVLEAGGCVPFNVTFTRTNRKTCRYGLETYLELGSTVTVGPTTAVVRSTIHSQDPAKYILLYSCFNVLADGTCTMGDVVIQIRDTRTNPNTGEQIDLSTVPWHKVNYDLYKLTGLKFGDPDIIYTWLGPDCRVA